MLIQYGCYNVPNSIIRIKQAEANNRINDCPTLYNEARFRSSGDSQYQARPRRNPPIGEDVTRDRGLVIKATDIQLVGSHLDALLQSSSRNTKLVQLSTSTVRVHIHSHLEPHAGLRPR